ncbi:hypothetical protein MMC30_005204 [Trapelia coarctata]|nr:hypothetical protein [Trapelia coarctata]
MDGRTRLKPVCVAVSQVALQYKGKQTGAKQVIEALEHLYGVLHGLDGLDEKLADYVFFPLSYIFRDSKTLPSKAVEITLSCLQILIDQGWRQKISPDLCEQLLILLGYFAGRVGLDVASKDVNELSYIATFRCMACLFELASASISSFSESDETESLPAIGYVVTVILAALTESSSVDVQLQAVRALRGLISSLSNEQMLRNFLPGITSSLTKVLQPNTRSRRPYRVLAECLETLAQTLEKTLSNRLVSNAPSKALGASSASTEAMAKTDPAWLKASTAQIKLALANIAGLRTHERSEVLEALFHLCVVVLRDCSEALSEAATLMLETSICICSRDTGSGHQANLLQTIQGLVTARENLADMLKTVAFDWISALPRVLLSTDDAKNRSHLTQIATAYKIISSKDGSTAMLEATLPSSLHDATVALMDLSAGPSIYVMEAKSIDVSMALSMSTLAKDSLHFNALPVAGNKQSSTLQEIYGLVNQLGFTPPIMTLMKQLTNDLPNATGNSHLASLWLSSRLFHDIASEAMRVEQYLEDPYEMNAMMREFMAVTYAHSIDLLSAPAIEDGSDWRLQALALEVVAKQSAHNGPNFRPELVDALYPVLERVGSSNTILRDHALTCLNILARACKYQSASDLIVHNADYLVNAVALKFNTFELSPQAPQVIRMMVRLCGPILIPYLDDLVDSIFSTLASFHGYPRLAVSLFSVLNIIVEEGKSTSLLAIEGTTAESRRKVRAPMTIADVADYLKHRQAHAQHIEDLLHDESPSNKRHAPDHPWKSTSDSSEEPDDDSSPNTSTAVSKPPPPTKTYTTTLSIVRLTQHYLTHSSPTLRLHLLHLTSTGCLALSQHEDEYLPVVNEIWPVVVKRLYDPEPFVCIAATEALSKIFQTAGDFVSSRVAGEWEDMCQFYGRVYAKTVAENKGKGGWGKFTESRQIWEALVGMFVEVAMHVRVDADMEDDLMEMLAPLMERRSNVRDALEALNQDAVWLHLEMQRQRQGGYETPSMPTMEGFLFKPSTT